MRVVESCEESKVESKKPTFGDLKAGDAYIYGDNRPDVYMKVKLSSNDDKTTVNCLVLQSGYLYHENDIAKVTPLPNAKLVKQG